MKKLPRRTFLEGIAAAPILLAGRRSWAAGGPTMASEIDIAKAKAEGKVTLYTSLDTKIVDAIVGPFKKKYGIAVEYFRGGSADVTSKVLAEADAGRIQADMVDASDLAALLVMKERGLLLEKKSEAPQSIVAGPARPRRNLDGRPADPGGHPVQRQRVRRRQGAKDMGGPRQAGVQGTADVLQQRQRRRRAAPLHDGQALRLGLAQGACREPTDPRCDAAVGYPGSRERRARRGLCHERQHRLALETAGQADGLCLSGRRACRPSRAPSAWSRDRRGRTPRCSSTNCGWGRRRRNCW